MKHFLPGDFIKPDPTMTRLETRRYILDELESCLKERVRPDEDSDSLNDMHLQHLSNPRERMFHVKELLEELNHAEAPGKVAYEILQKYLNKEPIDYDVYPVKLVQLVMGFLHTDRLPCERTIFSFWNHSPFGPLRNAPPLPDEDDEQDDEEEEYDDNDNDEDKEVREIAQNQNHTVTIHISFESLLFVGIFVTIWIAMLVANVHVPARNA
jgi:hypothetical protein